MKKKTKKALIISLISFVIIILISVIIIVTKQSISQSALPDDLPLFPTQFLTLYDFPLESGNNNINLNDGVDLNQILGIYYTGKSCSLKEIPKGSRGEVDPIPSSETITFTNKNYDISFV